MVIILLATITVASSSEAFFETPGCHREVMFKLLQIFFIPTFDNDWIILYRFIKQNDVS